MKALSLVAALLLLLPLFATPATSQFPLQVPLTDIYLTGPPDRTYELVMSGHTFNLQRWPGIQDSLILEAYLGERVQFTIIDPATAEPHTFHLHGHPWFAPSVGRTVDTWLLHPGEEHGFSVIAGGVDANPGDWMFHCHFGTHAADGMWGIFRVYPFRAAATLGAREVRVDLDRLGVPVDDAHLLLDVDGKPLASRVVALGHGAYVLDADLPATGVLTIDAHSPSLGMSVARIGLGGTPVPPLTTARSMGAM